MLSREYLTELENHLYFCLDSVILMLFLLGWVFLIAEIANGFKRNFKCRNR